MWSHRLGWEAGSDLTKSSLTQLLILQSLFQGPFKKAKHDGEDSSSRGGKKPRRKRYVWVEFARRLWEENRPVPWPDVNLPGGGWYLNSRRVPVPPVPEQIRERREEVRRRRTVLPPDLRDDPAFAVTSYNWIAFGTWEFDPRRRAGYLGDEAFFDTSATDDDGWISATKGPLDP